MNKHRGRNEGSIFTKRHSRADGSVVTRYVAQVSEDGKQRQLGSYRTRTQAQQAIKQHVAKIQTGENTKAKTYTFGQWAAHWLMTRERSYATRQTYRASVPVLCEHIGTIRLQDLRAHHFAALWAALEAGENADGSARDGGPLARSTIGKYARHLKAIVNAAALDPDVALITNPALQEEARPPMPDKAEIHPLTEDELKRMLAAADAEYHALLSVLATTGMRCGEVAALRWADIDWEHRSIAVQRSLHREAGKGWCDGPTKTRRSRVITLQPAIVDILHAHKKQQNEARLMAGPAWQDAGYVFTDEVGRPLDQGRIERALWRAFDRAGIGRRTPKELRHTFATIALRRRVPPKMVSEALGHSKISITLDVYSHVIAGMHEDAFDYLGALFA